MSRGAGEALHPAGVSTSARAAISKAAKASAASQATATNNSTGSAGVAGGVGYMGSRGSRAAHRPGLGAERGDQLRPGTGAAWRTPWCQ